MLRCSDRGLSATAALVVVAALLACAGGSAPDADAEPVVSVKTATVGREPIAATATAVGTVRANREAVISAPVSGQLGELGRIENQSVRAGQVLTVLAAVDFYAAQKDLRQSQASVDALSALAVRRRALFDRGGISRKDLDDTELELTNAQADLRAAQSTVGTMSGVDGGRATVRAPFDGVIVDQMQFGGEFVSAGAPLFKVADLSELVVQARFADTVAPLISEQTTATIEDEASPGQPATGTVDRVGRTSDPDSRTMQVWVHVDDPARLRVGDAVQVTATTHSEPDAIVVPTQAVQLEASNAKDGTVMIVDGDGVAHEKKVTVGIVAGDRTQIVDGLVGGEIIVTEGNYALPDGTKVAVQKPDAPADEK